MNSFFNKRPAPISRFDTALAVDEARRIVRYAMTGLLSTIAYVFTVILLTVNGADPILSNVIGVAIASIISYLGHLHFTFRVEKNHPKYFWRFTLVVATTLLFTAGITFLVTKVLRLPNEISIAAAVILIPATSYIFNRCWVFFPGLAEKNLPGVDRKS